MKRITYLLLAMLGIAFFATCQSDTKLHPESIFQDVSTPPNELDNWIKEHFTTPYNIRVNYKFVDNEISTAINVDPARIECAKVLLYYINHVWIGSFNEVAGPDFIKENTPRLLQLIGSSEYKHDGTETLGIAEGGVKITLTNVNVADPKAERNEAYWARLNKYCFHVIFHEFGHILHQTKNYPTDFNLISVADYKAGDWVNLKDEDAPKQGFISGYASMNTNEDFVELFAFYVTESNEEFTARVNRGLIEVSEGTPGQNGIIEVEGKKYDTKEVKKINDKVSILKDYMNESWGVDIDKLRAVIAKRMDDLKKLDITKI
ncbi:putative zinc-binding metallopeptidase [Bacteroides sp. KG68]|uniref:zinc-binding metallopeptidase n=1 Tax=unclassified Bacteroides TaxID=2646097 RepID=UPI003D7FADA1